MFTRPVDTHLIFYLCLRDYRRSSLQPTSVLLSIGRPTTCCVEVSTDRKKGRICMDFANRSKGWKLFRLIGRSHAQFSSPSEGLPPDHSIEGLNFRIAHKLSRIQTCYGTAFSSEGRAKLRKLLLGWPRPTATLGQHCPQMTQRLCIRTGNL